MPHTLSRTRRFETHKSSQKLNSLRTEADNAIARAEEAEAKNKRLEQELLSREQDISSLTHRLDVAQTEIDKYEGNIADLKRQVSNTEGAGISNDALQRKVTLLEEELDASEKNLKETVEKYVSILRFPLTRLADYYLPYHHVLLFRLRQVDIKAEELERQATRLEQERDQWEKKYEVRDLTYRFLWRSSRFPFCIGYGEEVQGLQKRARRVGGFHGGPVIRCRFFSLSYVPRTRPRALTSLPPLRFVLLYYRWIFMS